MRTHDEQLKMEMEDMIKALKTLGNEATLEQKANAMEQARRRRQNPISYLLGVLLVLLAGAGCAPHGDTPAEEWCQEHRCDFVDLAFDEQAPEGHGGISSALRTLNAASGLDLIEDPMGIPIRWEPEVYGHDGERACGITEITRSGKTNEILSIEITIASEWMNGCKPDWMVVRHEIACHALTGGFGHIETGICSPWADTVAEVDQASLDWMCEGLGGCPAIQ